MPDSIPSGEIRDLTIAAVALLATFLLAYASAIFYSPLLVAGITVGVLLGFLLHELGHRFAARALGYYAFFKAWKLGIILSVLSGLIAGVLSAAGFRLVPIIAAPGAVYVIPRSFMYVVSARRDELIISSAGPLMNILLTVIGLVLFIANLGEISLLGLVISSINAWLAVFNLLPVPPLDGYKIIRSNIVAWIIIMVTAFGLLMVSNRFLGALMY